MSMEGAALSPRQVLTGGVYSRSRNILKMSGEKAHVARDTSSRYKASNLLSADGGWVEAPLPRFCIRPGMNEWHLQLAMKTVIASQR